MRRRARPNVKEIDPLSAFLSLSVIKIVNAFCKDTLLLLSGKRRTIRDAGAVLVVRRGKLRLPGQKTVLQLVGLPNVKRIVRFSRALLCPAIDGDAFLASTVGCRA